MAIKDRTDEDHSSVLPRVYIEDKKALRVLPQNGDNQLGINPDGSVNVNVVSSATSNPIEINNESTLTDQLETTVFSYTVTNAGSFIESLDITASAEVIARLKINGTLFKQLRTSPSSRNDRFIMNRPRSVQVGDIITVTMQKSNNYTKSDVETFVLLEGYYL